MFIGKMSFSPVRNVDLESGIFLLFFFLQSGNGFWFCKILVADLFFCDWFACFIFFIVCLFEMFTGTPGQRVMIISWQRLWTTHTQT